LLRTKDLGIFAALLGELILIASVHASDLLGDLILLVLIWMFLSNGAHPERIERGFMSSFLGTTDASAKFDQDIMAEVSSHRLCLLSTKISSVVFFFDYTRWKKGQISSEISSLIPSPSILVVHCSRKREAEEAEARGSGGQVVWIGSSHPPDGRRRRPVARRCCQGNNAPALHVPTY
jgi:hypothetical protein